jgi:hypothetical protein
MSGFDSLFGTSQELAEAELERMVARSRARMDADEETMLAGPDDDEYVSSPALSRIHPYGTGAV